MLHNILLFVYPYELTVFNHEYQTFINITIISPYRVHICKSTAIWACFIYLITVSHNIIIIIIPSKSNIAILS